MGKCGTFSCTMWSGGGFASWLVELVLLLVEVCLDGGFGYIGLWGLVLLGLVRCAYLLILELVALVVELFVYGWLWVLLWVLIVALFCVVLGFVRVSFALWF